MQAAQWGWLHSTPERWKQNRLAALRGVRRGIDDDIPGRYLLDALFEAGPTQWSDGSEGPLSWQELAGYITATGELSEPWEARAVMSMSRAYFRAKQEGRDVHCIPPVDREHDQ